MYSINQITGQLVALSPSTYSNVSGPQPSRAVINPAGTFLYESIYNAGVIDQIAIAPNGQLSWVTNSGANYPTVMAIHPNGNFMYYGDTNAFSQTGNINWASINPVNGNLTNVSSVSGGGSSQWGIAVNSAGTFLYVGSTSADLVKVFTINLDGSLSSSPISTAASGSGGNGPSSLAFKPSGDFLYASNNDGSVTPFSVNQVNGHITALTSVATGASRCGSVTVDSTGSFLYTTGYNNNELYMYSINQSTGLLTALAPPAVTPGNGPFKVVCISI
jgi:6-phosphogluconolactonase